MRTTPTTPIRATRGSRGPGCPRGRFGGGRAVAAAALLPVLALSAACGGGGSDSGGKKASPSGTAGAALAAALLTSEDVGHVQVLGMDDKDQLLGGPQKIDRPDCRPVADQWSSAPAHPRLAYAGAMVTDTADKDPGAKTISLTVVASYAEGEAAKALEDLAAGLRTCTSYKTTRNGVTSAIQVHATAPDTAGLGDGEVAYTIGDPAKGTAGQVLVTVIRVGDTTAAYESVRADHTAASLRPAIPAKQVEKLREAAANG